MISFTLFTLSGVAIVTLTIAKRIEEKRKKDFFILNAISRGDIHLRKLHHKILNYYSEGKEKLFFLAKKQVPMRAKSLLNRSVTLLKETAEKHIGNARNSRLLKKSDGISEFFKNISSVEKGIGEINESYNEPEFAPETTPKKRSPRRKKITVVETE